MGSVKRVSARQVPTILYNPRAVPTALKSLKLGVNTFRWHLQLPTLDDLDHLGWLVSGSLGDVFNELDDVVALENLAEDDVAAIEPARSSSAAERHTAGPRLTW